MRKIISGLISLILFVGISSVGVGYYVDQKAKEILDQTIASLKQSGFELSSYESLEIDFFEQKVHLKNLQIASTNQIWFKLNIGEVTFEDINPINEQSVFIENTSFNDINVTYFGHKYKLNNINLNGLKFGYQPRFEQILQANKIGAKIQAFHQQVDYKSISFKQFSLTDNLNNISQVEEGRYTKQALINYLPSEWNLHLLGIEINRAHLSSELAQTLSDYDIKDLNGILDISFDYQTENHTAVFAINNLNFGGLANLQSDILVSMTDKRLLEIYNIDDFDKNINQLPIEHAELSYTDLGFYNHFIKRQAPLLKMTENDLRAQINYGIIIGSAGIQNLDRRRALTTPLFYFIENPANLTIELSPAKPIRFEHYLNLYDANILIRDLNPSIEYSK